VKSVEVREVNNIPKATGVETVGGRYVFHHMTYSVRRATARAAKARPELADSEKSDRGYLPDRAGRRSRRAPRSI
jgi:hypothetical protein